jgi:hypothetical protein
MLGSFALLPHTSSSFWWVIWRRCDYLRLYVYSVEWQDDWWILNGNEFGRSDCGLTEALSRNLHEGTKKNTKNISEDRRYFGRDSN